MGGGAAAAAVPKAWVVHAALVVAQAAFGGGAIVGKFGVHGTNPVLFALIREGFAGPLLCLAALVLSRREALKHRQAQASSREALRPPPPLLPSVSDIPKVVLAGSCLFFNQLFFILGLKFMDPIICSVWQLSQPVMTTCIAVMLGFEQPSAQKLLGMFLAIGGAVFMVLAGAETTISRGISEALLGHALLFSNCLSTSLYVIVTKGLVKRYLAVSIAGLSYIFASVQMAGVAISLATMPSMLRFVCSNKVAETQQYCIDRAWEVPDSMFFPLVYMVLFCSCLAYLVMTWANQYAAASVVSIYTVMQPLTSSVISWLLILTKGRSWASFYGLAGPGIKDAGALGIVAGLSVMFRTPTLDEASGSSVIAVQPDRTSGERRSRGRRRHGAQKGEEIEFAPLHPTDGGDEAEEADEEDNGGHTD